MIGYIYEISNHDKSIVYIGSTTKSIKERWLNHQRSFKFWLKGEHRCHAMIYHHFKEHGIESFKIKMVSSHQIETADELKEFEQNVIDKTENTCNKQKAFIEMSREEYNKVFKKEWYQKNKDSLKAKRKQYLEENKDQIRARQSEKLICECGIEYTRQHKSRHIKTKRHQDLMRSQ